MISSFFRRDMYFIADPVLQILISTSYVLDSSIASSFVILRLFIPPSSPHEPLPIIHIFPLESHRQKQAHCQDVDEHVISKFNPLPLPTDVWKSRCLDSKDNVWDKEVAGLH